METQAQTTEAVINPKPKEMLEVDDVLYQYMNDGRLFKAKVIAITQKTAKIDQGVERIIERKLITIGINQDQWGCKNVSKYGMGGFWPTPELDRQYEQQEKRREVKRFFDANPIKEISEEMVNKLHHIISNHTYVI